MKFLENKWTSFACCGLNGFFAIQSYATGSWIIFGICSAFTILCGYNFWIRMGEE